MKYALISVVVRIYNSHTTTAYYLCEYDSHVLSQLAYLTYLATADTQTHICPANSVSFPTDRVYNRSVKHSVHSTFSVFIFRQMSDGVI